MSRLPSLLQSLNDVQFAAFREWLEEEVEELKSLDNVEAPLNPITAAIELRASKKAYLKLKQMFAKVTSHVRAGQKAIDPRDSFSVE